MHSPNYISFKSTRFVYYFFPPHRITSIIIIGLTFDLSCRKMFKGMVQGTSLHCTLRIKNLSARSMQHKTSIFTADSLLSLLLLLKAYRNGCKPTVSPSLPHFLSNIFVLVSFVWPWTIMSQWSKVTVLTIKKTRISVQVNKGGKKLAISAEFNLPRLPTRHTYAMNQLGNDFKPFTMHNK